MKDKLKKFIVTIEQPLCKSFEIEASSIDDAEDIAREKYNNGELVITIDDKGTEAMLMVEDDETGESTEWN